MIYNIIPTKSTHRILDFFPVEACGRKWRSTGRLTLGDSKATKEQRSGFEVVRDCFTEGGDSVVGVFCLELLRAKLPREYYKRVSLAS